MTFFNEVQAAGRGWGKVSLSALDKAIEAVYSCKEYLADTMVNDHFSVRSYKI